MRLYGIALLSIFSIHVLCAYPVFAVPPSDSIQAGEIAIEETEEEQKSSEQRGKDQVRAWISGLKSSPAESGRGEVPALKDEGLSYMAVLYLYCLNKLGPCPFILDALLESDVQGARAQGEASCPTLSRFWKMWLTYDLENRAKYLFSIGTGTEVANFNARERSRYLQCKPTVAKIIADQSALKARYQPGGTATTAVAKTAQLFEEVQAKRVDIYSSVGVPKG